MDGTRTVAGSTAHAGRHASSLDVYDGVRRVRPVDRRSHPAQVHRGYRRAAVQVIVVHDVVVVVFVVVHVQRHLTRNAHDHRIRTRQSGQRTPPVD